MGNKSENMARWERLYHPVWQMTQTALDAGGPVLLGIDGMSAAGKSHLAEYLAAQFGGRIIHADDFFLQQHQRTPLRLAEAGGNIDYERLAAVVAAAKAGQALHFERYNCQTGAMQPHTLPAAHLTIVEGAYSLHPKLGVAYDLRVFLRLEADCQKARIHRRSPQREQRFLQEWTPMELRYFEAFKIPQSCDVVLDTTPGGG